MLHAHTCYRSPLLVQFISSQVEVHARGVYMIHFYNLYLKTWPDLSLSLTFSCQILCHPALTKLWHLDAFQQKGNQGYVFTTFTGTYFISILAFLHIWIGLHIFKLHINIFKIMNSIIYWKFHVSMIIFSWFINRNVKIGDFHQIEMVAMETSP